MPSPVLPDLLQPNLRIVFCGTAAGTISAQRGHYYAHLQNKFWATLHAIGLTSRRLDPSEFRRLADWGIGLTDIAKHVSGKDWQLPSGSLGRDACEDLRQRILANSRLHQPHRRAALSRTQSSFRRTERDDRRDAALGASVALAGGALELARERAMVARACGGGEGRRVRGRRRQRQGLSGPPTERRVMILVRFDDKVVPVKGV
jgi:hypothetical protein